MGQKLVSCHLLASPGGRSGGRRGGARPPHLGGEQGARRQRGPGPGIAAVLRRPRSQSQPTLGGRARALAGPSPRDCGPGRRAAGAAFCEYLTRRRAQAADLRQGGCAADHPRCPAPVWARRSDHLRGRRGLHQGPAMPHRPGRQVHLGRGGLRRYAAVGLIQLPARRRFPGGHAEAGRPGLPQGHLGPENLTFRLPGPGGCGKGLAPTPPRRSTASSAARPRPSSSAAGAWPGPDPATPGPVASERSSTTG